MDHYNLIIKSLSGKLDDEEKKVLDYWILSSEENQILYEEIKLIWENASFENLAINKDEIRQEEDKLLSKIHKVKISKLKRSLLVYQFAASVLLLVTFCLLIFSPVETPADLQPEFVYLNSASEQFLPDSSEIALNRNSTLSYSENEEYRKVKLTGEAFFNVTKSEKPFIIETNIGTVKVLGTSFNVRAYPEETNMDVDVISGLVQVFNHRDSVFVTKNNSASIIGPKDEIISGFNENQNFIAWKTRQLEFYETELEEVFRVMENYYDVEIKLEETEISNCKFTGTFNNISLRDLLNIISYTAEINFEIVDTSKRVRINITGKGCPKQLQS